MIFPTVLKRITLCVLIVVMSPVAVFAQTPDFSHRQFNKIYLDENRRQNHSAVTEIYKRTMELCNGSIKESSKFVYYGGKQVALLGLTANEKVVQDTVKYKGLSGELGEMLDSEEFYDAVEDCYPGVYYKQVLFISSLVSGDIGGKILSGIGVYYIGVGIYKFFGGVADLLGLSTKSRKVIQWATLGLAVTGGAIQGLEMHYRKKHEEQKAKEIENAAELLKQQNLNEIDQTLADDRERLKSTTLSQVEKEMYQQEIVGLIALREKALR